MREHEDKIISLSLSETPGAQASFLQSVREHAQTFSLSLNLETIAHALFALTRSWQAGRLRSQRRAAFINISLIAICIFKSVGVCAQQPAALTVQQGTREPQGLYAIRNARLVTVS